MVSYLSKHSYTKSQHDFVKILYWLADYVGVVVSVNFYSEQQNIGSYQ